MSGNSSFFHLLLSTTYIYNHNRLRPTPTAANMRVAFFSGFVALLASVALAVEPKKSVLVTYTKDTPDWFISKAKDAIIAAVRIP